MTHVKLHHVLLIRSLFLMIGAYIYGKYDGVDFGYSSFKEFPDKVKWSLFKRSMYGFGSIIATFLAIQLMPVSIAVSIMMTTAFVTSLIAFLVAGEKLSGLELLIIMGGFSGVIILTNPSLFTHETFDIKVRNWQDKNEYPYYTLGIFCACIFSLCSALNFLAMREIGNCVHSSVKTYYFGLLSSVLTFLFMVLYEPQFFEFWNVG